MTPEEFVAAEAAKPFVRAVNDCTMMCDRWVQLKRGISPVQAGGIVYHDDVTAMALEPRIAQLMNRAMRRAGLSKTDNPQSGDVGLAVFGKNIGPAILVGDVWITRHREGLVAVPRANYWKAWAVCERDT